MSDDEFARYDPSRAYGHDAAVEAKKQDNRRFLIGLGVGFVVLCVIGIIVGQTSDPAAGPSPAVTAGTEESSVEPSHQSSPSPTSPTPWAEAPKKGKWPKGVSEDDVPYGAWSDNTRFTDHRFKVTGPPEFTTLEPDDSIIVRSPVLVERIGDRWPDRTISDDLGVYFGYGKQSERGYYSEASHKGDIECGVKGTGLLKSGERVRCYFSYTALPEEVPNFTWFVNRNDVAAWPGQS